MPLVVLEASKANASPEAVGQPLSRKNEPDERVHGNTGRRGQKSRNEKRDWTEGLWRKRGYTNKTFKVTARRFWQMAKETAPPLEFDDLGKLAALRSSCSWVLVECRLDVALRWLARNLHGTEDLNISLPDCIVIIS
mmetsp:Transcript_2351/g.5842  ORF Transcript_2351/g.5842 Transcript_2351/m.5842 type:complete len:137 (-) Transcript_2351:17-427(-)